MNYKKKKSASADKSIDSKDLVNLIKGQAVPPDDLRIMFESETDRIAVPRFRLCVAVLIALFLLSMLSQADGLGSQAFNLRAATSLLLLFFGLVSFLPLFRKNCYSFTVMVAFALGGVSAVIQRFGHSHPIDQMSAYTLFFLMMGFFMPWGALATMGVCLPLYLFYPLSLLLNPGDIDPQLALRANMYLAIYIVIAAVAAGMNEGMRFHEFSMKKRMQGENALLQDYQTRLTRAYERAEHLSVTDTLTGVHNRSYLTRWLTEDVYKDKDCADMFSVIMFDVDGFKTINDVAGHLQGDRVLQLVPRIIEDAVTERILIFRYGGDEFCIMLPGLHLRDALDVSESLRRRVERDPDLFIPLSPKESFHVTISVGVTMSSARHAIDADFLIKWVDTALLKSKKEGRNCIHVFDPEDRTIISMADLKKKRGWN